MFYPCSRPIKIRNDYISETMTDFSLTQGAPHYPMRHPQPSLSWWELISRPWIYLDIFTRSVRRRPVWITPEIGWCGICELRITATMRKGRMAYSGRYIAHIVRTKIKWIAYLNKWYVKKRNFNNLDTRWSNAIPKLWCEIILGFRALTICG